MPVDDTRQTFRPTIDRRTVLRAVVGGGTATTLVGTAAAGNDDSSNRPRLTVSAGTCELSIEYTSGRTSVQGTVTGPDGYTETVELPRPDGSREWVETVAPGEYQVTATPRRGSGNANRERGRSAVASAVAVTGSPAQVTPCPTGPTAYVSMTGSSYVGARVRAEVVDPTADDRPEQCDVLAQTLLVEVQEVLEGTYDVVAPTIGVTVSDPNAGTIGQGDVLTYSVGESTFTELCDGAFFIGHVITIESVDS